jgi:hypothetical protein
MNERMLSTRATLPPERMMLDVVPLKQSLRGELIEPNDPRYAVGPGS